MHITIAVLLFALQDIPKPVAVDDRLVVELVAEQPQLNTPTGLPMWR